MDVVYRGTPKPSARDAAWSVFEQSSAGGTLQPLATPPSLTLAAPDGSGTLTTSTSWVVNGSSGNTVELDFQPESGVVVGGTIAVTVPKGWTPPTTKRGIDGYVQSTRGKVTVSGQQITVAVGDLREGGPVAITYENGRAPSGVVGTQTWVTRESSTPTGTLRPLHASPQITVLAPDGSGTLQRASGPVKAGSSGNTVVFVYTPANGGINDGTIALTVPPGWNHPSLRAGDRGYVTASTGSVSVSGETITVSGVTLATRQSLTLVYGSRAGGGSGASAPSGNVGPAVWPAAERSSSNGTLRPLP